MEKLIYLNELFDMYQDLLTEKQQMYFKDYYFDNLTLSEISENNDVSRNAVHKAIKEAEEKLLFYEEKLKLLDKKKQIDGIINLVKDKRIKDTLKNIF